MSGTEGGFVRRIGLFQSTAINMSQMCGIGPFVTIPLMVAAFADHRPSSASSRARCSRSPTG